jgi:hypothetical protein
MTTKDTETNQDNAQDAEGDSVQRLVMQREWQTIDTAPENTPIDVWSGRYQERCANAVVIAGVWFEIKQFAPWDKIQAPSSFNPTHWLPIPTNPNLA